MEDIKTVALLVVSCVWIVTLTALLMFMAIAKDLSQVVRNQKIEICELGGECKWEE